MNVLVTGGAGYIGSHVVRALLDGHHQVAVVDDLSSGNRFAVPDKVAFYEGDFADVAFLNRIIVHNQIKAVIHLAGLVQVGESMRQPELYYTANVAKTMVLLDTIVKHNIRQFVFSSSAAVYKAPEDNRTLDERSPCVPSSPYGQSKRAVELLLDEYYVQYGLKSTCLRYFNAAGADYENRIGESREVETHLIPLAIDAAVKGWRLQVFGNNWMTKDGSCVRDYVHVRDIARAHVMAINNSCVVPLLNLGTGQGVSVFEVLEAVGRATKKPVAYEVVPPREGDVGYLVANPRLALKEIAWEPEFPNIQTMVAHAYLWYVNRPL